MCCHTALLRYLCVNKKSNYISKWNVLVNEAAALSSLSVMVLSLWLTGRVSTVTLPEGNQYVASVFCQRGTKTFADIQRSPENGCLCVYVYMILHSSRIQKQKANKRADGQQSFLSALTLPSKTNTWWSMTALWACRRSIQLNLDCFVCLWWS